MRNLKITLVLGSVLFALASFQNCSEVQFASVDPPLNKVGDNEVAGDPDLIKDQDPDLGDNSIPNINNDDPDAGDASNDNTVTDNEADNLATACLSASFNLSQLVQLSHGASLVDLRGNVQFAASHLELMAAIRGNILVAGHSSGAQIDLMSDIHGNIILCGIDVARVENHTRGNLIVINGSVGEVDNFHGNMVVINGQIGSVVNSRGNIRTRTLPGI